MWVARVFKGLIIGLILFGLFMLAASVFFIALAVIAALGIVAWLRKKGIITKKTNENLHNYQGDGYDGEQNSTTIIDGEYKEITSDDEVKK